MKKVIRLTETDLTRIIKRVIMEQESNFLSGLSPFIKITKLYIDNQSVNNSYAELSTGEKYNFSDKNSANYTISCNPGTYTNINQLPQYCKVYIDHKTKGKFICTKDGCEKQ